MEEKVVRFDLGAETLLNIAEKKLDEKDYIGALRVLRKSVETNGATADEYEMFADIYDEMEIFEYAVNYAAKCCGADIAAFSFNTAVARLMELTNAMYKYDDADEVLRSAAVTLIKLMAPVTPHICEELWERAGEKGSVLRAPYPVADESKLVRSLVEVPVQLLGRLKGTVTIAPDASEDEARAAALALLGVSDAKKFIYKPGRIINVIA